MDYISIRVSTLRGDQKIGFDTYVKINDKMILYLKQGDSFEGPRLQKLKDKKLRKMFILKDEETRYLDYLKVNIDSAYDLTTTKDINSRAEIIQGSQQSNVENIFDNPEDAESYNKAKEEAGKYVQFILTSSDSVGALMSIENTDQNIAHHGVSVSTLAVSLAKKLNITDEKKIQLMALGGLLHDYGHNLNPVDLGIPIKSFTPENYQIWKNHPKAGAISVQDKKHFDLNVLNIIMQHEEKSNGTGPLGIIEKNQDPLATIVSSANTVDRLLTFEKVKKADIPKKMMMDYLGAHPLNHIQHLNEIIKRL
jgi:putative nucleotidyltransferase with HDIG domain